MEKNQCIILVGYMGSGKSSVSGALRSISGLPFLDTDEEIARRAGKTVSAIFAEEGEEAFRAMETRLLQELIDQKWKGVLSTGGGMPVREENRRLLKQLGTVIYLKTSPETICKRLEGDTTRPLLAGLTDRSAKLQKIREMLEKRQGFYEEASQITVNTDGRTTDAIAREILTAAKP